MTTPPEAPTIVDRYAIHQPIAAGGMATVHFGRFMGPAGFTRIVAIKRMHAHLAKEPEFVAMFLDEARLAARIRHPNVVPTLDVVARAGELLIVMEYAHGESLLNLLRTVAAKKERVPPAVACAIVADVLSGLHAAHEARGERGEPLDIVHRDVSPHNVIVGADGVARVVDFGVAKAVGRVQQTLEGQVKGKIAYMAPEQIRGGQVTRAADVYAASVVLWETLTSRRLFKAERDADLVEKILFAEIDAPSARAPNLPEGLNTVVLRGLSRNPADRFPTARDMVRALRECQRLASASEVADWVEQVAGDTLVERASSVAAIDHGASRFETTGSSLRIPLADVEVARDRPAIVLPTEAVGTDVTIMNDGGATPGRRVRRRRVGLIALGVSAIALVVVALVHSRRGAAGTVATPEPSGASVGSAPSAPVDVPVPMATETATQTEEDEESAAVSSEAPPSAAPVRPRSRPRRRSDCTPPYTTAPDGTRRYKLQCL